MRIALLFSLVFWLGLALMMQGCAVKIESAWFGTTAKDDREYTPKKPAN